MIPNVLSIAGSDPGGGAGIQADLKTFAALDCHGMAAVTALTAQNTTGVSAVHLPPPDFVAEQIRMVFADIAVAAVKIGMLGSAEIVAAVAAALAPHRTIPIVLDPVLVATSGAALGDEAVVAAMWRDLIPLATLVTPNLAEAARLADTETPATRDGMEHAVQRLVARAPVGWLVKGGHAEGALAEDLLLLNGSAHWLSAPRVATKNTHGTGCTLSSAIAAYLAQGRPLAAAVAEGKAFVTDALAGADRLSVGHGAGPVDHFARKR